MVAGSPAEHAGLKPGDVVVEVDRQPVGSSEEAVAALRAPQKTGHLLRVRGAERHPLRHGQVTPRLDCGPSRGPATSPAAIARSARQGESLRP